MKREIRTLIFILLSIAMTTTSLHVYAQSSFPGGGTGTEQDPYLIKDQSNLILMRDYCGSLNSSKHFRLTDDITVTGAWTPIGNVNISDNKFTGYLHGGGHTISGLQINNREIDYVGLFGYNEGTIDSLYIEGTNIRGGQYAGGLVGRNAGAIIACHAVVDVSASSNSSDAYAGGLVGYNTGDIHSSSAEGYVESSGSASARSGGLIGYSAAGSFAITDCFAKGDAYASAYGNGNAYSGGLIGYLYSGAVTYCYTIGKPSASTGTSGTKYIGAFIGYNASGNISDCYYNIDNTGSTPAVANNNETAVYGRYTAGMITRDIYDGWDFNDVWGIGGDYPYLRTKPLRLTSIMVNLGALTPAFHPDTLIYTVDVNNYTIDISASCSLLGATILAPGSSALVFGKNQFSITVKQHGGELAYTVNVHREYKMNFRANNGQANPQAITVKSGVNKLPVITRKGYEFKEWNTKLDGDSIAYTDETVQEASGIDTLYAQWIAKEYTLYFDALEGSVDTASITVTYNNFIGKLPDPVRTGYDFEGWNIQSDGQGNTYSENTVYETDHDTTVYAQWKPESYTLYFKIKCSEGTNPSDESVHYGSTVSSLPAVACPGHDFKEWNDKEDGSGKTYETPFDYDINDDMTLYAQWTEKTYILSFNTQGGGANPPSRQVTYDASVGILPTLDARQYYTFGGWNTLPDGAGDTYADNAPYQIDGDTTFYAIWTGDAHKLIFHSNYPGGSNYPEQTVNYGSPVGTLPSPIRTGYTFIWNTVSDGTGKTYESSTVYEVAGNTNLYAVWTAKSYTLSYDAKGGTVTPASKTVTYGKPVGELPIPSYDNHTFIEWNAHTDGTGNTYTAGITCNIDKDTTIYAQWAGNAHILRFDAQGGNVDPSEKDVRYGSSVGTLPTPSRAGYKFDGWFTEADGSGTSYPDNTVYYVAGDLTVYAKWTVKHYTLSFNANYAGGLTDPPSKDVTFGIAAGILPVPIRSYYDFNGWNTEPYGTGKTYDENTIYNVADNTSLYAQWKGKQYTITFYANESGVTNPSPKPVYYDSPVGELPYDIRPGYTPVWNTKSDGTGDNYYETTIAKGDVKLYAQWTANSYTLSFDAQGGSVNPTSQIVVYYKTVGKLPDAPTRAGYIFKGWYTSINGSGTKYDENTVYNVAGNSTIYAKWEGKDYELSFNVNYPEGVVSPLNKPVAYGSPVGTLPVPNDRTNYTFEGWNTAADGSGADYHSDTPYTINVGNGILYAKWIGVPSILAFEPEGGSVSPSSKIVYYGSKVGTLPTPKRPGFDFTGWNTNPNDEGTGIPYTSDKEVSTTGNVTLYAQWVVRTYTITFDANYTGGNPEIIANIYYSTTVTPLPVPVARDHYKFKGWSTTENGNVGEIYTSSITYLFDVDITLYAKWLGDPHSVKFYTQLPGETDPVETRTINYGSPVGALPVGIRLGYTPKWNTAPAGNGIDYNDYTTVTGNVNLYAQWTANPYLLFFDARGGDVTTTEKEVIYHEIVGELPVPAYAGYDFKEWNTAINGMGGDIYTESTEYKVAGNTHLYAQWNPHKYTLTFNANGGTVEEESRLVEYNSPTGTLPVPVRTGYTFKGWWNDSYDTEYHNGDIYTKLQNTVLYAKWTANKYTVTFSSNGGGVAPPSQTVTYDEVIGTLPNIERTGYDFIEWKDVNGTTYSDGDTYNKAAKDITLYAQWAGQSYTLAFDAKGGTVSQSSKPVQYDSPVGILPVPTLTGHTFYSWQDINGNPYTETTVYTEADNTALYAQWTVNEYTVKFDINHTGGGISPSPIKANYDSEIELPSLIRKGYTFDGWNTIPDGSGDNYTKEVKYTVTGDISLYARWTAKEYTITFNSEGEDGYPKVKTVTYDSPTGILPVLSRTGYTFGGWFNGDGEQYVDNAIYETDANINLYAKWTAIIYTVNFDINWPGGTNPSSQEKTYGLTVTLPSSGRTGYAFNIWNTQPDGNGANYEAGVGYTVTDNITFYAQWTANTYILSFDSREGSPVNDKTVTYGSPVGTLSAPTRTGHTFNGWQDDNGTDYTVATIYTVPGNTSLSAEWTVNEHTLSFDANYANAVILQGRQIAYGSIIGKMPDLPARTGYTPAGWNTQSNGEGLIYTENDLYLEDRAITLYAQWAANKYYIIFNTQGGTPVNNLQVSYNSPVGTLAVPERTGYTFDGWFTETDGNGTEYTGVTVYRETDNAKLYAKWTASKYTLSFDSQGGSSANSRQVTYGEVINILPEVTRLGYTFDGWFTEANGSGTKYTKESVYSILGNTTLYAKWTLKRHTISFDSQGGSVVGALQTDYDATVQLTASTRTGYTFKGWNTKPDGTGVSHTNSIHYTADGDMILYAQWEVNSYTLNFDAQGGDPVNSLQITYGEVINNLPGIIRAGYTFDGWFTETNGGGTKYTVETVYSIPGNTTLYAKWTLKRYTVSFDAQGGSTVGALQTDYDAIVPLTASTRAGYTFKEWNTKPDGKGVSCTSSIRYTTDGDMTLYAQWEVNSYTLNFDAQGGNPVNSQPVTYQLAVGALPSLTRTGYTFDGWFTGTNGGGAKYAETTVYTVAGNTTLYAKWTALKYLLNFNVNYTGADSNPPGRDVIYGSTAGGGESLPVPQRQGYTFTEWNTEIDGSGSAYISTTIYTATGNTTLYAQWTARVYTLSFEANYIGEVTKPENPASRSIVYGSAVGTLPSISHSGYIFMGWNTAENGSGETYTETSIYNIAGNAFLYAQWKGIAYTVNFAGNNVELDPQAVTHGAKIVKPSDPTLQGYAFAGWYKDNDLWDFNTPVTGDILLTAKWISSDTELKSLSINTGRLSPEFSPSISDYAVTVSYDVATVSVTGLPHNSNARVTGNVENMALKLGDNYVKITVIAEDGVNARTYMLTVTRADHIMSNDANLIYLTANAHKVEITGNTLEYVAGCGETSFALELEGTPYSSVAVNGSPYAPGQIIPLTGDVTVVNIHITSETGNAVNNYTLKANAAINENRLYYLRWPDVFGVNANPDNNGGYEVTAVRWFRRDGSPAGNKGYIQMQNSVSNYYAEIQTVQTEGWRHVCGVPVTRSTEKIVAYPNPVPQGESLKLELPVQYVGGALNIYDVKGSLIKSKLPLPAKSNSIDVSGLSSGIYILNITKDNNRDELKIIVE